MPSRAVCTRYSIAFWAKVHRGDRREASPDASVPDPASYAEASGDVQCNNMVYNVVRTWYTVLW